MPLGTLRAGKLPPVPPLTERDRRRRPIIEPSHELHLQGGGCGEPGALALAALLPKLPRLLAIVLPYQDLRDGGALALAEAAATHCPALEFLMLSRNDVTRGASAKIDDLLPHLDSFHLRVNNVGG